MNDVVPGPLGSLRAVRYYDLAEAEPLSYRELNLAGERVDIGVELESADGGFLSLTWVVVEHGKMPDYFGYLVVVDRPMTDLLQPERHRHDVTTRPEWNRYVGQRVVEVHHVWDTEPLTCRVAARLRFEDGGSVTLALGEPDESGGISYTIDTLVVLHDENVAALYRDALLGVAPRLSAADVHRVSTR